MNAVEGHRKERKENSDEVCRCLSFSRCVFLYFLSAVLTCWIAFKVINFLFFALNVFIIPVYDNFSSL